MNAKRKASESSVPEKRPRLDASCRYQKDLGHLLFVVINEYKGEVYVHIRQFEERNGKKFPTKTGAALTPLRWKEFVDYLSDVEKSISELSAGQNVRYIQHLGGNWFVRVTSGFPCVDVRKFWLPEGEEVTVPTRKGIALKFAEFNALLEIIEDINSHVPELADVVPCSMKEDHQNQMGALNCPECHPNYPHYW